MTAPIATPMNMPAQTARRSPVAFTPLGLIGGMIAGLGGAVLLQQYGVRPMTLPLLLGGIVVGALVGIALPSIGRAIAPGAAQPTAAHLPISGPVVAGWAPTHAVPESGTWAWAQPDPAAQPSTSLAPGVEVQLVSGSGDWVRVRASNGWEGWVDGRQIRALPSAPPTPTSPGSP